VPVGQALGFFAREEPRVRLAVVAHGQRAAAKVDDLHRMWMASLRAEGVIMVAPVSSHDGARCYLGHLGLLGSSWYLIHGPSPPHPFADFTRKLHDGTGNLSIGGISSHMTQD
jgi:hypothetical protein